MSYSWMHKSALRATYCQSHISCHGVRVDWAAAPSAIFFARVWTSWTRVLKVVNAVSWRLVKRSAQVCMPYP